MDAAKKYKPKTTYFHVFISHFRFVCFRLQMILFLFPHQLRLAHLQGIRSLVCRAVFFECLRYNIFFKIVHRVGETLWLAGCTSVFMSKIDVLPQNISACNLSVIGVNDEPVHRVIKLPYVSRPHMFQKTKLRFFRKRLARAIFFVVFFEKYISQRNDVFASFAERRYFLRRRS